MAHSKKRSKVRKPSTRLALQQPTIASTVGAPEDSKKPATPAPPARDDRDTAFYGAVVNAWIATRMEKDKSILTLSAAGDALLVTLLTTVGPHSWIEAVFYALAFAGFTFSAWTAVRIFDRNADYLARLANDKDEPDPNLGKLDRALLRGFLFGVVCSVLIASSSALARYSRDSSDTGNAASIEQPRAPAPLQPSDDSSRVLHPGGTRPPDTGAAAVRPTPR